MSLLSDLIDLNDLSEFTEKLIAEYLWIGRSGMDLRSKARTLPGPVSDPTKLPKWNYDGSSTNQASAGDDSDGSSTNQASAGDDSEVILHSYKWPLECYADGFLGLQGPYYCVVGADKAFGSDIVDAHHKACLYAGINNNSGVNVEVMPGQFDWNGAGAHCNYSTTSMRNDGFVDVVKKAIEDLSLPGYVIHDFNDEDIGIKIAEHSREIQWPMWTVSHLLSSSPMEKVMSYYRASKVADNLNDEDLRCFLEERLRKEKAGLSEKIVTTRLKTKVHVPTTEEENPDSCSICMVGYKEYDKIGCLYYCRHEYHAECIKEWLFKANLCPICRALAIIPEDYPCWDADVQLHQAFFAHCAF